MKKIINHFINSIDTKLYSRIRASKGDAECRRYLKEHLHKQLTIHSVVVPKGTLCWRDNCNSKTHKDLPVCEKHFKETMKA